MSIKNRIALVLAAAFFAVSASSSEPQTNAEPASAPPGATQPRPQFVNLGADKCVPCRKMVPVRQAIAEDYAGQIEVSFIDVWKDRSAGEKYKIRIIPTQIVLDAQGQELFRHEGYWPKEAIVAKFQELGIAGVSSQWVQRWLAWQGASPGAKWLRRACGALVLAGGVYLLATTP